MMKKLLLLTLALSLAVGGALAKEPEPEKPLTPFQGTIRATETEPNNDCGTASLVVLGEAMEASINPVGDIDWFEIDITQNGSYTISTEPGVGQSGGDTQMYLYAADCTTQLAYDDDGGTGLYSLFTVTLAPGTYFARVNEYGNNGVINAYVLNVVVPPPPPANDTCAGAINLDDMPQSFTVNLCAAVNDYSPGTYPASCTGYTANGPDVVYYAVLPQGGQIDACITGTNDLALYLITDCGDPVGSCVDGDDSGNPECISWVHTGAESTVYYLIVDSYSGCSTVTVTIDNLIPTEESSFSSIKSRY